MNSRRPPPRSLRSGEGALSATVSLAPTPQPSQQPMDSALLETAPAPSRNNLGTINGCYIPCLLNILGAPLFLFVGFAVGMMGWVGALGLFFFSELIAYLTITSFSALVTNGQMKGGGAYYMISRSLGPAFGGSSGMCGRPSHPPPPPRRLSRPISPVNRTNAGAPLPRRLRP